jgi:caspase 7
VVNKPRLFCAGHVSWRTTERFLDSPHQVGAWFIQALCQVLEEDGKYKELMWMMTKVCRIVAITRVANDKPKQIPCIVSLLTRSVYFPPKRSLNSSDQVNQ